MSRQSIFIVEDDASVRDSLALMLSLQGFATASFTSAEDFLAALKPDWAGCVLADIRLAGMSGLALLERLARDHPALSVVIITAHGDVAAARQAFLSNAVDFIEKPFTPEQIFAAIAAAGARTPAPPRSKPGLADWARGRLTEREAEVLRHIVRGRHNREIAQELRISPRTVEVHKARILEKLEVRNVVELVRLVDGATDRSH